ncbi:hypothetical protein [Actinotalea sp. K2]|uniref:hypothetical protein n=1 Tax=Actinotalea sp. K2 TaxID=2939438 RepID=UPI00201723FE|nr:hypothetical protein [Actinotalea sp. K2]MCL3860915.1 hypothetical protein [Actinotalea sp. K2]
MGGDPAGTHLERLTSQQRDDGSWGHQLTAPGRIVPTIFAARSVQEAGLDDAPCLARALDFLARVAIVDGGGSIHGTRDSVVPCYTGMLARLLVRAGRGDAALPLLRWVVRHQPVAYGGVTYHQPTGPLWGEYLRTRYGGCMAATTCLLGLVPAVSALVTARRAGIAVDSEAHVDAMHDLLVDRRVMLNRSGAVMALAGRTRADPEGTRWVVPAFPLDYTIDLLELVQLAVDVDVPAEAMAEAVELIGSWRLPDGGWPMLGTRRVAPVYRTEPVDRRRRSATITRRVEALGLTWT